MKLQSVMRIIIGTFVFVSALLGYLHHPYWLFFTMFVGLNMFQFGMTGFCPLQIVLKKMGFKE
jgi:hypothetical protein